MRPAAVSRDARRYAAGEHSLVRPGLPSGAYVVRFRGPQGDEFHRLLTGP